MSSNFWITINDDLYKVSNTAAVLLTGLSSDKLQGKVLPPNYLNAIIGTKDKGYEDYRTELSDAGLLRYAPCSYELDGVNRWGWRYRTIEGKTNHRINGWFSFDKSINNDLKGFLLRLSCLVNKKTGELDMSFIEARNKLKMTEYEFKHYIEQLYDALIIDSKTDIDLSFIMDIPKKRAKVIEIKPQVYS